MGVGRSPTESTDMSELIDLVLEEAAERMAKAVSHARHEFSTIRTGRASSALIENLLVDYYGSEVPIKQLANFSVPEARLLVVNPFDKGSLNAVEKAIRNSDLGLNPSNDGVVIRLAFPALTEERRRDFVKKVRDMAEHGKVAIRNARRDARRELEALARDGEVGEDDVSRGEKELDRITHGHEADIDRAVEQKEAELLEV
jgi:ribosome recycling factor